MQLQLQQAVLNPELYDNYKFWNKLELYDVKNNTNLFGLFEKVSNNVFNNENNCIETDDGFIVCKRLKLIDAMHMKLTNSQSEIIRRLFIQAAYPESKDEAKKNFPTDLFASPPSTSNTKIEQVTVIQRVAACVFLGLLAFWASSEIFPNRENQGPRLVVTILCSIGIGLLASPQKVMAPDIQ